jgi:hypothetical protein
MLSVWDSRKIRKPIAVAENLDNLYSETNVIFSPDDKYVVTGLPGRKGTKGSIVFLNSETLVEERRVAIGEGSVVRVLWHSRINQVSLPLTPALAILRAKPRLLDHRDNVNRSHPCPLLPARITSRCPSPSTENATYSAPRSIILYRRPQTGHLHTRRLAHVCGSRAQDVITSKREEGEDDETDGTHDGCR